MKNPKLLFLVVLLFGIPPLVCSCSTHRTVGGEPLTKRASMKRDAATAISKIVEEHLGRDVFWDGPYRIEEAARHASIGATESTQIAYSQFAARHRGDRFFICFDFVVLYSKGRADGYMPKSVFAIGDRDAVEWFDLNGPIQSPHPTTL